MKKILLGISLAMLSITGLAASSSAEARDYRSYNRGYDRVYVSPRDVVYKRGMPYHRHRHIALHVVRDRYGDPVSYYLLSRNDRYDRYQQRRHDRRHRAVDRFHERDNVVILYRD